MKTVRAMPVAILIATMTLAACGSSPSAKGSAATVKPPAVVTETPSPSATPSPSKTAAPRPAAITPQVVPSTEGYSAPYSPPYSPPYSAAPLPDPVAPPVESSFDRPYALLKAGRVIEDIHTVDSRMLDGIAVDSGLRLLSGSFGYLASAGVPPGLDAATYLARLSTLESFASQAANEITVDPTAGSARYAVLRQETAVLLTQLNGALGTQLSLG